MRDLPLRWTYESGWQSAGLDTVITRRDAAGWRTDDGMLMFGGWHDEDLSVVSLIDNQYANLGKR